MTTERDWLSYLQSTFTSVAALTVVIASLNYLSTDKVRYNFTTQSNTASIQKLDDEMVVVKKALADMVTIQAVTTSNLDRVTQVLERLANKP